MSIDLDWLRQAGAATSADQLVLPGQQAVADPVARVEALFEAWAVGFASQRADVGQGPFRTGARGWHPDECAALIRALDARQLHIDSAGYAWPLCAEAKANQSRYALCCKDGDGVTVNLEYMIQLGALAELNAVYRWRRDQLRVELGEFDAAAVADDGSPVLLMEAKCRATDRRPSADTLEKLLRSWLDLSRKGVRPERGTNASNKYVHLLAVTERGPVTVLLVAAGARWWLRASRVGDSIAFDEVDEPEKCGR